ncbi:MAG: YbaN family protein [Rhodospirillales bacterium]
MHSPDLITNRLQPEPVSVPRSFSRSAWLALGYLLFGTGILGMFLPVMPTTVFWILAAGCFLKSSPAMYQRIITTPRYGDAVRDMVEDGIISRPAKIAAVSGMAIGALFLLLTPAPAMAKLTGCGVIALSALIVTSRPSVLQR